MGENPEIGKSVNVGGINTNYIEAGNGYPIVLIHGSGPGVTAFANWRGVIPDLAKSFHVFAPDMVGFGYTDCPEDIEDFTLDVWVDHISGFMEALSIERAHFIGNSYGGALTLALAVRRPDLVDKFVLMGAAGLDFEMTKGLEAVWGYEPSPQNMRKLMETFAFNASLVTDEIVESRYQASIRPGAQEAFSRLFPPPRQEKLSALATPEAKLHTLENKCLIVHGREDVIVPVEVSYRFSSLLKNSELHVFGGCGHWTQIEKRDRFLDVVMPFLVSV
ncbi:alpha/beta fold hydrolase [Hyphococcus sp.]|uniref:alpha/beta fold hydrolase n=1 Tax=Hyphococcus sp. TaxID=2038636 RepID=UPI0035C6DBF0